MKWTLYLLPALFLFSCGGEQTAAEGQEEQPTAITDTAQYAIEKAVEKHGGALYANSVIAFDFRGRHYISTRKGGAFTYERIFTDTSGNHIRDVLTNDGFYRGIDGKRVALSERDSLGFSNSVNSVLYFALLPYFLNDPAAHVQYLGESVIRSKPHYKVKVTFGQEGGGKDFQDEFVYWIHKEGFTMDYLAYNYLTDGGGARFREAHNVRTVNGIRFADYINYKPVENNRNVALFDSLFENGGLEELSRIDSENVEVQINDDTF